MTQFLASIPSPPQGVWHLGPLPIRAYALFIIVGIIVALIIGDRRWVARGGEPGVVYDIALWAVPFGLVGGRLYHVMTDWRTYFGEEGAGLVAALRIWDGGLGIWGAVALGGIGAWIGCRQRGIPLPAFADAIAPGIILAQAIGRLGNYFNQELFGRPTSLPWGLRIYERRDASGALDMLNGVSTGQPAEIAPQPVHPTFLYELIWNVLVFLLLIYVDRRFKIGHGRLFALYVAAYCVGRFGVELLRDDTATLIAGIRINLFTSTFVFLGAMVYVILAPKGREDPAVLGGKPHELDETADAEKREKIPAGSEDSALVEWTRELAAVASTSGVVAGVAVAVEDEDEAEEAEEAQEAEARAEESQDAETAVLEKAGTPGDGEAERVEGEPHSAEAPEEAVVQADAEAVAPTAPTDEEQAEAAEVERPATAEESEADLPLAGAVGAAAATPPSRSWLRRLVGRKPKQQVEESKETTEPVIAPTTKAVPEEAVPEEQEAEALQPDIGIEAVSAEVGSDVVSDDEALEQQVEPEAADGAEEPQQETEAAVEQEAEAEEPSDEESATEAEAVEAEPEEPSAEESGDGADKPVDAENEDETESETVAPLDDELGDVLEAATSEDLADDVGEPGEVIEAEALSDVALEEAEPAPGTAEEAAEDVAETEEEEEGKPEASDQVDVSEDETQVDADAATSGDEPAESEAETSPSDDVSAETTSTPAAGQAATRRRRLGLPRRLREFRQAWADVPAWQKEPKPPSD
ncbi:MAG: prolipoprotein diacylglyceryl transferase [Candidatus Sericytochromatia bacterium]